MRLINAKATLLIHSRAKVELLREYLATYLRIICNDKYTQNIHIYDMFCGEGIYRNGGKGSPIQILEVINTLVEYANEHKWKLPVINCNFNDTNVSKIENLKKVILEKGLSRQTSGQINFSSLDYKTLISQLTPQIESSKNDKFFVFVDPYGYKGVKVEELHRLLATRKVEILLWMPIPNMFRFINGNQPAGLSAFLNAIKFPKGLFSGNIFDFINTIQDCFKKHLGNGTFVDYYSLRRSDKVVYCMYFFTSHILGFEKMLETKWALDTKAGKGWNFNKGQISMFENNEINQFEQSLKVFIQQKPRSNGEIYLYTLSQSHKPSHATQILGYWHDSGLISLKTIEGNDSLPKSFYIKYFKTGSSENNKVIIQFK